MILKIIFRIFLLIIVVGISLFFFPSTVHEFVTEVLEYQRPTGVLGLSRSDWIIAWIMSASFWVGIVFGALGKKIDYIFILSFFLLMSLNHFYTANMTWLVYSGFVGATVIGVLLGFGLKLLRQKFFPAK